MIFVKAADLRRGMRLAKPIYNKMGVLLYERDTKLTMQGIESVKNFGLIGLYILEPAEPVPVMSEADIEFERFQTMAVFIIKDDMRLLLRDKKPANIFNLANTIIQTYGKQEDKINFTQNLRSSEDYIYKHSLNVAILSALMADKLNLTLIEQSEIVLAALLHDLGKLTLPYSIRVKHEKYDEEDLPYVKKCLADGLNKLKPEYNLPPGVKKIIGQWHKIELKENEKKEKLSIGTKILRVAELFDTKTAMKISQEPESEVAVLKYLLANSKEYDMSIIEALVDSINILSEAVCVELTNREKGLVIQENRENVLRPTVLGFTTNQVYDLRSDKVYSTVQVKDIMKTMDNRIVIDRKLFEEYKNKR